MKTRLLIPEVIQSSVMDCGPAALKALLEGHGIAVSYGRLREACQTELDGVSIDTLEEAANALGLDASQVMVPEDNLTHPAASLLPAVVMTTLPGGGIHFVVVWRRIGARLQVMDPASGRHFIRDAEFRRKVYLHTMRVDAAAWREWASSEGALRLLRARLADLHVADADALIATALADDSWHGLGALDAAVRMLASLRVKTANAGTVIRTLVAQPDAIPQTWWRVRGCPDTGNEVSMTGAVLIAVSGTKAPAADLPPQLRAALETRDEHPFRAMVNFVRRDSLGTVIALLAAICVAAAGVAAEAVLFRGFLDMSRRLVTNHERMAFVGSVVALLLILMMLEWPIFAGLLRIGRRLEIRFRMDLFATLARLPDRFFRSRLESDMAHRAHAVHQLRDIAEVMGRLVRSALSLTFILIGLAILYDGLMPLAIAAAAVAVGLPLLAQPMLAEKDLKVRTYSGSLARFYFDGLLGLVPIRVHGARPAFAHEQSVQIEGWASAVLGLRRGIVVIGGLQYSAGLALTIILVATHLRSAADPGGALLLAWWALSIPAIGQEIAVSAWQLPRIRNTAARLLEPLGERSGAVGSQPTGHSGDTRRETGGIALRFEMVNVLTGGHVTLNDVSLGIGAGEHIAIVGSSGAGKSTLVGLLLGWHEPARGNVFVDGSPLDAARLEALRRETIWIDPQIRLWNDSALANLQYGNDAGAMRMDEMVRDAKLEPMLHRLRKGMATKLGENGALLAAADGQRLRIARALGRGAARLVICDEAGRGLDRDERRDVLRLARTRWPDATILCVTHDIEDALEFPRVLVIENARVLEDGDPRVLAANPESRFRALLDAEARLGTELWSGDGWLRYRLQDGVVGR